MPTTFTAGQPVHIAGHGDAVWTVLAADPGTVVLRGVNQPRLPVTRRWADRFVRPFTPASPTVASLAARVAADDPDPHVVRALDAVGRAVAQRNRRRCWTHLSQRIV